MAPVGEKAGFRILGLTGPIGCGKTTIGDILLELGAIERIDADRVVHTLMQPETRVTRQIRDTFGDEAIGADGGVDRKRLATTVFHDASRLQELEAIVHPAVRTAVEGRIAELADRGGIIVLDAIRLLQSDLLPLVSEVWVVRCSPAERMTRLIEIRGMTSDDVQARIAAQPSFDHAAVSRIIWNSGSLGELREQIEAAWQAFLGTDRPGE